MPEVLALGGSNLPSGSVQSWLLKRKAVFNPAACGCPAVSASLDASVAEVGHEQPHAKSNRVHPVSPFSTIFPFLAIQDWKETAEAGECKIMQEYQDVTPCLLPPLSICYLAPFHPSVPPTS